MDRRRGAFHGHRREALRRTLDNVAGARRIQNYGSRFIVPSNLSALLVTLDQWVTNMLQPISGIETRIYRLFLAKSRAYINCHWGANVERSQVPCKIFERGALWQYKRYQAFRDVHAITQHIGVNPRVMETTGRVLFGLEPDTPLL